MPEEYSGPNPGQLRKEAVYPFIRAVLLPHRKTLLSRFQGELWSMHASFLEHHFYRAHRNEQSTITVSDTHEHSSAELTSSSRNVKFVLMAPATQVSGHVVVRCQSYG